MKHFSKITKRSYLISESINPKDGKRDDITLIWDDNGEARALVDWYWGGYDYGTTEYYISKHIPRNTPLLELPICYVHVIETCLNAIKKHDLYKLLDGYDADMLDTAKSHITEVFDTFLTKLLTYDIDTAIYVPDTIVEVRPNKHDKQLRVCEHCLQAIMSREGVIPHTSHDVDLDETVTCDWCDEPIETTYYELI